MSDPDPLQPGGDVWRRTLSPSKGATILGLSRFDSPYALWHRTKGLVAPEPDKDIFAVGHAYEHTLAHLWKERNPGWQLSPGEVQIRRDDLGVPAIATLDRRARRGSGRKKRRVVEFKIARDLEEWGDEFTDQAPPDYRVQVQLQQLFTGYVDLPAHLMVMGPFFQEHIYEIEFDERLAEAILAKCVAFWQSLKSDVPPPLDDTKATYECVRKMHPDIDGTEVQLPPGLSTEFLTVGREIKDLEKAYRGLKTQVLDHMGDAAVANCGDQKIATRSPHASGGVQLTSNKKADIAAIERPIAA